MSEKTLKTVLGILGGLIVVYAVAALASGGPDTAGMVEDSALAGALETVAGAELDGVRISGSGDTIRLERTADGWTANGYPADSSAVAELESALGEVRIGHLASTNPANHAALGVAEDSARLLELIPTDGDAVRLLVGESGPSWPSAYVRLPAAEEVYLVHGDLGTSAQRSLDDWRDRTIVRVDTAAVARIAVTRNEESYTLQRDSAGWHFAEDGAPVDEPTVHDLLAELADLQAAGFAGDEAGSAGAAAADAEDSAGPAEESADAEGEPASDEEEAAGDEEDSNGDASNDTARTVVVFSEAGDNLAELSLTGSSDGGSDFLVTIPGREVVFELAGWRADRITPTRDDIEAD